ncbi:MULTISPECIES: TetR/AcrR family transcriptional regulator [Streptomyces]|uniref:TetR family transcriptional regulator n=1 Tax=Streptomyces koelreuteriae TaxID=2838015 RepID=A0ABX8FSW0_9ACTN|nr:MULTISPECIES: TetR/AcrR family transcriptional regulator [Streptomyces]QWB24298.1 TetR family transcriptional regulator [Streptomyces koelreuteriae]UUA07297.1 TetR/AcrR family transcriptional regulator [Streptomyces koelreuteriae]UUA14926.1 TetR/AcrR family transcriptional regulator [Streptomyces sp. CRCS-T-1]
MAGRAGGATGRPPLTERRRAETRMEIAEEAVRLFAAKGVAAVTAEDIASASGVSTRTLWRYFRSKEECVRPLLTTGLELLTDHLREGRHEPGSLAEAILSVRYDDDTTPRLRTLGALLLLCRDEPGLRAVWLEAHYDAEATFAEMIADRTGRPVDDLAVRVEAGVLNTALRVAVEEWALRSERAAGPSLAETVRRALRMVEGVEQG